MVSPVVLKPSASFSSTFLLISINLSSICLFKASKRVAKDSVIFFWKRSNFSLLSSFDLLDCSNTLFISSLTDNLMFTFNWSVKEVSCCCRAPISFKSNCAGSFGFLALRTIKTIPTMTATRIKLAKTIIMIFSIKNLQSILDIFNITK